MDSNQEVIVQKALWLRQLMCGRSLTFRRMWVLLGYASGFNAIHIANLGRSPTKRYRPRKVTDLPHIRRQSRNRIAADYIQTMEPHGTQNKVLVFDTPEQVALAAAEKFVAFAQEAIADHGAFTVSLAGGNTPRRVYELLASDPFKNVINWSSVHLFFGDERCVPPHHQDSNYGMVYKALISKIEIPPSNVHRIAGEGNPEENAAAYEWELRTFFGDVSWPRFDLVLLGMGEDGHTASLFPGSDAVKEKARWVVATRMEQLKQDRITLTIPVLNHAAHVVFLVTGKGKARRFSAVTHGPRSPEPLPAQLIRLLDGSLEWLVDKAVASSS